MPALLLSSTGIAHVHPDSLQVPLFMAAAVQQRLYELDALLDVASLLGVH